MAINNIKKNLPTINYNRSKIVRYLPRLPGDAQFLSMADHSILEILILNT